MLEAQLSCQQCSRRKIKCNKHVPCSACIDSGFVCEPVHRKRKPRGRNVGSKAQGRDNNLKTRIDQLETAVAQLRAARVSGNANKVDDHTGVILDAAESSVPALQLVATDFWSNLTSTIDDIRGLLQAVDEDETSPVPESASLGVSSLNILGVHTDERQRYPIDHASLLEIYTLRFDPLLKIVDWSVLRACWQNKATGDQAIVQSAVLFAAAVTVLPHETTDRDALVQALQLDIEDRLNEARFLTSESFTVLQAFVLYIAALRATRAHAQQWALLPLAIRLASSHGLSGVLTDSPDHSNQIRLRLWYSLGMLDLQSSFDRGSQTLMTVKDFNILPVDPGQSSKFTDMTTSLLTYRAMLCQRKLIKLHIEASETAFAQSQRDWWQLQLSVIKEFKEHVESTAAICSDPTDPLQAFTMVIARESLLTMKLLMHRPLQKIGGSLRPHLTDFNVMQSAMSILQSAEYKTRPEFMQWAWYAWVKWYVLAIVLAELCQAATPWSAEAEQAWYVSEYAFARYAKQVNDTQRGLLWKPVAKLFGKVKAIWQQQQQQSVNGLCIDKHADKTQVADNVKTDMLSEDWDKFLQDMIDPTLLIDFDITSIDHEWHSHETMYG